MGINKNVPQPLIGRSYEADDYGWLGKYFDIEGSTYQFCKFASGITPKFQKYDAVTISPAGSAIYPASNKLNGICAANVDATVDDAYALCLVWDAVGSNDSWCNVSHIATASADWSGLGLCYSADAAGFANKGRPVTAVNSSTAGAQISLTSATVTASASVNGALSAVYANLTGPQSKLVAAGAVSAVTGKAQSNEYYLLATASEVVTAISAPVKDYLKIGNVISVGGLTQVVTAVSTATDGTTATLATAIGTAAIGTGAVAVCSRVYVGNMRVKSILD